MRENREAGRPVMGRVQHCRWEIMVSLTREVTVEPLRMCVSEWVE